MKIVLDTNIWISALLYPNSKAGNILRYWHAAKFSIVTSQPILDEIKSVLLRPKIAKHVKWDEMKVDHYVTLLKFITEYVVLESTSKMIELPNNPSDTLVLNTFLVSNADYLVTGDSDLLNLKSEYSILSLNEFCDML